ncbi:ROK family transcriptional regulator [Actinomyces provencensis]|uniref:ROK family transcriptional regulator n=1 Tax=Actinomyces provencensis TaxID=1720198 RepID=UPI00096A3634|nr:ROK family transcriptional regulator [Actinomyces provencensis]
MRLGANQPRIGTFNERVILDALRRAPGQSLTELSSTTGLAVPTVSGLLKQLTSRGLVSAIGTQRVERGRPRTRLALVPEARFSVGIHLDPTVITIALLDLAGRARSTRLEQGALDDPPDVVIERIVASTASMIAAEGVDRSRIVGAGVASPGPIDLTGGRLVDPPWLPGWQGVALREELEEGLEMSVLFEKDTTAAVVGETWLRREDGDVNVLLFVYVGVGIGVGVTTTGEVMRGSTGNAGEIGGFFEPAADEPVFPPSVTAASSSVDPSYLVAWARDLGILEDRVVEPAEVAGDPAVKRSSLPQLADIDHAFSELCDEADSGEPRALQLMTAAGAKVARMVEVLTDLMDVDTVVMGGPYWGRVQSFYEPEIRERLSQRRRGQVRRRLTLSSSLMGESAGAIGAAAMVLDERYVPRAAMLAVDD